MTTEDNKQVVRRYRELHESNNLAALDEVLAPAFVAHAMAPGVPQTPDGARMIHNMTLQVFPDLRVHTELLLAEGDYVVERWRMQATHTGAPFFVGNVPASGRKVDVDGITIYRLANGKIVETWANMDFAGVLQQVGAMPSA